MSAFIKNVDFCNSLIYKEIRTQSYKINLRIKNSFKGILQLF